MPRLKKRAPATKPEKIRISKKLKDHCLVAWKGSNNSEKPFSDFLRRLIHIGVNVYERQILPIENGEVSYSESESTWDGIERRREKRQQLDS